MSETTKNQVSSASEAPQPLAAEALLHNRYAIQRFLEAKEGVNLYRAMDTITDIPVILKETADRTVPVSSSVLAESEWAD